MEKYLSAMGHKNLRSKVQIDAMEADIRKACDVFVRLPTGMGRSLIHIVVDEAHTVVEWGETFRVSYKNILELKEIPGDIKWAALTAKASHDMEEAVTESLQFGETYI